MWPFSKVKETIVCFFCKIKVDKNDSFQLEYRSTEGIGKITTCPMCAGMLDDIIKDRNELFND